MSNKEVKKWVPNSDEWKREAVVLAVAYCPNIFPCSHCGYPYINGYRCTNCGSNDPEGLSKGGKNGK